MESLNIGVWLSLARALVLGTRGPGFKSLYSNLIRYGEMAEWSIAAVLKTVELEGSVGSNPTLSVLISGSIYRK